MQRLRIITTIVFLVLVVIPLASTLFDEWMEGTQTEMIENQAKLESAPRAPTHAQKTTRLADACARLVEAPHCQQPKSFQDLESCLARLRTARCDTLPDYHLCAAVEEMPTCRSPRNARIEQGCDGLRAAADCSGRPAPKRPTHNWSINTAG